MATTFDDWWQSESYDRMTPRAAARQAWEVSWAESRKAVIDAMAGPSLTPQEKRVLEFVVEYRGRFGMSPTLMEIADHFGTSKVTSYEHVHSLIRKRVLKNTKHRARSLVVVGA